ncbi:hypothetical protein L3X38_036607 [Prunus dulcis]|uniref:Uncharacterized protein n=1 Tax=Prunus dulcis TaxID=3755 RepID=A0AAD4YPU2_PRUDU|nr:hypothetical protein L3X38_036607 [Prunus dulcis]
MLFALDRTQNFRLNWPGPYPICSNIFCTDGLNDSRRPYLKMSIKTQPRHQDCSARSGGIRMVTDAGMSYSTRILANSYSVSMFDTKWSTSSTRPVGCIIGILSLSVRTLMNPSPR